MASPSKALMGVKRVTRNGVTHPFGDHRSVLQAFPAGISEREADPFLMCDYFNMVEKDGPVSDPDDFPVDWHPHRGFDIASYLRSGVGRHGDSLGNRETYKTPGMQWMSVGSGVEHAEGGATPKGTKVQGFQIWINVPSELKMEAPKYGTVPTEDLPLKPVGDKDGGVMARVLAGQFEGSVGPFQTKQPVQMVDLEVENSTASEDQSSGTTFNITAGLDTAMIYVYEGALLVNDEPAAEGSIILLDAENDSIRGIHIQSEPSLDYGGKAMLFAGKKLKQPIAWHGPVVMTNQQELFATFSDLQAGNFPPVKVDWDYKKISARPIESSTESSEL